MPYQIVNLCFGMKTYKASKRQIPKSMTPNLLYTHFTTFHRPIINTINFLVLTVIFILLYSCGSNKCKLDEIILEENNLSEDYCPQIDTSNKPLPNPSINKINIFFDASGSMSGFMPPTKQSSSFQILIPDIISKLETELESKIEFYPIYNSNSPMKPLQVNDAIDKIMYGTLSKSGGDTYIPTMLDSIYKGYLDYNTINIFISDCIYSPQDNHKKQAVQATREIRETINSYTADYFTSVFCLFSQFNKIPNSPYYLIVFGTPENNHQVEKLIVAVINNKQQQFKQVNFGLKYNQPYYSILPYTENSPNCIINPCPSLKDVFANVFVQNWNADYDSVNFWIGINLNSLPSYATSKTYLDSNLVLTMQKGDASILTITSTEPSAIDKDDKIISDKSTHFLRVKVSRFDDCVSIIQIGLKFSTPTWINDLNQIESEINRESTFGLERMMNGFAEAYKQDSSSYFFNDLNVSLIKQ